MFNYTHANTKLAASSAIACFAIVQFSATVFASDYATWQADMEAARVANYYSKNSLAIKLYSAAAENIPAEASTKEKLTLWFRLGQLYESDDPKVARKYFLNAEKYLEQVPTAKRDMECVLVYTGLAELSSGSEALGFADKAYKYAESILGKTIELAPHLVQQARTAYTNGDKKFAEALIDQALKLCAEADLEQKREFETMVMIEIAKYYRDNKQYEQAEEYYNKAIYAGESLWYPLYGWTRCAMYQLIVMLSNLERNKEANKMRDRLANIQYTGRDPKGKDVCKYWNGENCPYEQPHCSTAPRRNFNMHQTTRTPREIYQKPSQN